MLKISNIFFLCFILFIVIVDFNIVYATNQTIPNPDSDRINQLESRLSAMEQKQETQWQGILDFFDKLLGAIYGLPWHFAKVLYERVLLAGLGLSNDQEQNVLTLYQELWGVKPNLSPLEPTVDRLASLIIELYLIAFVLFSLWVLFKGTIGERAFLKTHIIKMLVAIVCIKSSFYIYSLIISVVSELNKYIIGFVDFSYLNLSVTQIVLNLDVITLLFLITLLIGVLWAAILYIFEVLGIFLLPFGIFCWSLSFSKKAESIGNFIFNLLLAVLLSPAISALCLAAIGITLQTATGISGFFFVKIVFLAGIILSVLLPLLFIFSVVMRPIVTVIAITAIAKKVL